MLLLSLDDLWPAYERAQSDKDPDWVVAEREQFRQHRDKDGDGKLDKKELGEWVLPEDFDHAQAEAKHLIYEADTNKVGGGWGHSYNPEGVRVHTPEGIHILVMVFHVLLRMFQLHLRASCTPEGIHALLRVFNVLLMRVFMYLKVFVFLRVCAPRVFMCS